MSASADCSCRARKGLRALPPASVVMCKVTEAACRGGGRGCWGARARKGRGGGGGGRGADGGRKQGGQSAAFYRRVPRPGVRAVGPSGHRAVGPSGRRRAPAVSIEGPARTGTGWLWIIAP